MMTAQTFALRQREPVCKSTGKVYTSGLKKVNRARRRVNCKFLGTHLATVGVSWRADTMGFLSSSPVVVLQPANSNTKLSDAAAIASGYFGRPAPDRMLALRLRCTFLLRRFVSTYAARDEAHIDSCTASFRLTCGLTADR